MQLRKAQAPFSLESISLSKAKQQKLFYVVIFIILFSLVSIKYFINRAHQPVIWSYKENAQIIIGITSSLKPESIEKRKTIRETWLQWSSHSLLKVQAKFIIGNCQQTTSVPVTECQSIEKQIENEEQQKYEDILFVNESDDYAHLVNKIFAFYNWIYENYIQKSGVFVIKIDEDVFIRLDLLLDEIVENLFYHKNTTSQEQLSILPFKGVKEYRGFIWENTLKNTNKNHKNYEVMDNEVDLIYPRFAAGPCYMLSFDLIAFLVNQKKYLNFGKNEDTTVGKWLHSLDNIYYVHDTRFQHQPGVCFEEIIVKHPVSTREQAIIYDNILNNKLLCTSLSNSVCPYGFMCPPSQIPWTPTLTCSPTGLLPFSLTMKWFFFSNSFISGCSPVTDKSEHTSGRIIKDQFIATASATLPVCQPYFSHLPSPLCN